MKYNVIDTDSKMHLLPQRNRMKYAPGDEVIGTVDADSPSEAIEKVLHSISVDVLRSYSPSEYARHILRFIEAVPSDMVRNDAANESAQREGDAN
jgi:hypothetical protein